MTNGRSSVLITANDNDEDDMEALPTQRVRNLLRADDEDSDNVHHFRVGSPSGDEPGKIPREGCVKAKGLIEPDEWSSYIKKAMTGGTVVKSFDHPAKSVFTLCGIFLCIFTERILDL